jgi:hypothetical protein
MLRELGMPLCQGSALGMRNIDICRWSGGSLGKSMTRSGARGGGGGCRGGGRRRCGRGSGRWDCSVGGGGVTGWIGGAGAIGLIRGVGRPVVAAWVAGTRIGGKFVLEK